MTKGQGLLKDLSTWIGSYVALPDPRYRIVLALWVIHTWVSERFDATPYLCVTASTKGAGKTRLLELLATVTRQGRMFADASPAALFRLLDIYDGKMTIFCDEAERMASNSLSLLRSLMNTGYRAGQTISRATPGGKVADYQVYCPKGFALIGDPTDTLRDRSIVIRLERARPDRDYDRTRIKTESTALVERIRRVFETYPTPQYPDHLRDRDREIWGAVFGVADALDIDKGTRADLLSVSADLVALKTAPRRSYREMQQDESEASDLTYSELAIQDLLAVIRASEPGIFSAVAVERMREIPTSPWRTYRGVGLDERSLAALVSRYGLQPTRVRMERGRKGKQLRGYRRADLNGVTV